MLKAIKELGLYVKEKKNLDEVEVLTESSKLAKTKKMICVVFKKEQNSLVFDGAHIEDFDQEKAKKILYRTFGHAQYDATLSAKLTSPDKLEKRWRLWFSKYMGKFDNITFFKLIKNAIEENKNKIFEEITEKYDEIQKDPDLKAIEKRNCIVTIKMKENNNERYMVEFPKFIEVFKTTSMEDFYYKHKVESIGKGVCCLCLQKKTVIPAAPFIFFTVDQMGFSYGFDRTNSWKQLPICPDCALDLQVGKEFLKNRFLFQLFGFKYFVIPSVIFGDTLSEIIDELQLYERGKDYRDGLLNAEEDILEIVKEKEDILNLIFVFYKIEKQSWKIIRYVEEVPPSWIKRIYDTFRSINQKSIFKEEQLKTILGEKWSGVFIKGMWDGKQISKLNLSGMIGDFFYHREKDRKVFDKSSLNILGDILEAKQIDKRYFIKHLIEAIGEEHERGKRGNEWNEKLLSLKSLYLLNFLLELGLVSSDHLRAEKVKEVKFMEETKIKDSDMVENFFSEFPRAFDIQDKKAVFLEGVLVSFLLDVQYMKRKDTPFRKKLHGLKLNKRLIRRLFPEVIEKLRQYDAGYPWLESLISKYLIEAEENDWKISDDEISYYFALGLNFGRLFKGGEKK